MRPTEAGSSGKALAPKKSKPTRPVVKVKQKAQAKARPKIANIVRG